MKIGIVCYPTFGGSGVVATELGKQLALKGHQVHFISYDQPFRLDSFTENIFYHEVRVSNYPLFEFAHYESALTSKLVDVVKYENLDLLHVHYAIPHASAAFLAKKILASDGIHIPFITTLHGTDITLVGKDPSFEPVISFAINQSDAVTAVSESLKQDTYDNFPIKKDIEVVYNFIDQTKYRKDHLKELKLRYAPNGEKILIHSSNFRKVKRIQDIIQIFGKVSKEIPSKLVLIGDGLERQKMENMCRELGTCKDTIFIGKVRHIEDIIGIGDLFLLTSEKESFGLSALEAMATGMPVISSNTGGIPEVNVHGKTGFLSSVGNIDEMSENALKILSNDELLNEMSMNAKNHSKTFDISSALVKYENLYKSVINKYKTTNHTLA